MIDFRLTPQSGYADSYLDIGFTAKFDSAPKVTVEIFNDTIKLPIEILGVTQGYIQSETLATATNSNTIEGYINLFNKDKMNKGLRDFLGVDIRCRITRYTDLDKIIDSDEILTTFYNQSESLDSNIIPFDLSIINPSVNLINNEPLKLHIMCDREKKYEICVRSEHGLQECTFEVITSKNKLLIHIPSEILWHDLELNKKQNKQKFFLYWVKFEGVDHERFMNRKYIRIDNSQITFNSNTMMPSTTDRQGPTGKILPDNFVLSHRYYVHTLKNWSQYGAVMHGFGDKILNKMTIFFHEVQNMDSVNKAITSFNADNINHKQELEHALWSQTRANIQKTIKSYVPKQKKQILSKVSSIYKKQTIESMSTDITYKPIIDNTSILPQSKPKTGGCGCSRKKNE